MVALTTEGLIDTRQGVHGEFMENSRCTWEIMRALQDERNWSVLPDHMKHALYMVAHKMARVLAGNPEEPDHWDDMAGYATLVAQRIRNPIKPIDKFDDHYHALSIAWNCTREEAKQRLAAMFMERQPDRLSEAQKQMAKDFQERQKPKPPVDEEVLTSVLANSVISHESIPASAISAAIPEYSDARLAV